MNQRYVDELRQKYIKNPPALIPTSPGCGLAMNMMLHGVEDPHITYQDSLSGENTERDQYSLIMANPPFTGSVFQEEISKDLLALCKTRKTELLFVALFTKMLKVGGRCACIVPDGVLFGSSKAHQAIRRELVERMSGSMT